MAFNVTSCRSAPGSLSAIDGGNVAGDGSAPGSLVLADGSLVGNGRGYTGDGLLANGIGMVQWMPPGACGFFAVRLRFSVAPKESEPSGIEASLDSDVCGVEQPRLLVTSGNAREFEVHQFAGGSNSELWMGVAAYKGALLTNEDPSLSVIPASLPEVWCRGSDSVEILVRSASSTEPAQARVSVAGRLIPGEDHARSEVDPFAVERTDGASRTYRAPGFTLEITTPATGGQPAQGRVRTLINSVEIQRTVTCHVGGTQ